MKGSPVTYADFAGGINLRDQPYQVAPNQARAISNLTFNQQGLIFKRCGSTAVPATGFSMVGPQLYGFVISRDTRIIMAYKAPNLCAVSAGVSNNINPNPLSASLLAFATLGSSATGGPLWMTSPSDVPLTWDGKTAQAIPWVASGSTPVPRALCAAVWANRVYVANTTGTVDDGPATLRWCALNNPLNWDASTTSLDAAGFVQFNPRDGQAIQGIGVHGNALWVFKDSIIFAVYDPATGANRVVSMEGGCSSQQSITSTPFGLMWLDDDGVYITTDGVRIANITQHLEVLFRTMSAADKGAAVGMYDDTHFYITIGSILLDFDLARINTREGFCPVTTHSLPLSGFVEDPYDQVIYAARSDVARLDRIFVPDVWQDVGVNYQCEFVSPWWSWGQMFRTTRIRALHIDGQGGDVQLFVGQNYNDDWTLLSTFDLTFSQQTWCTSSITWCKPNMIWGDTGPDIGQHWEWELGRARAWSLRLLVNSSDYFELGSVTWGLRPEKA